MGEDEDKFGSINDYYLNRIKFPYQFGDFEGFEEEKEEEDEHEDGQDEQEKVENEQEGEASKKV